MGRLTIFAKGNSDLSESLFFCPDSKTPWNGLNEALRAHHPGWRVRLRHETLTRSDALLAAAGDVPPEFRSLSPAAPYDLAGQFSDAFFRGDADAYILSTQADVGMALHRHRDTGALVYPGMPGEMSAADAAWIRSACEKGPLLDPDQSLTNLLAIVARLRQRSQAPILVYNLPAVVPGDTVDCYHGLAETLTTRIKRFNLALVEASARCGLAVVDVDRIVARHGADRLQRGGMRLTAEGSRLVAEEVLRILDAHHCFSSSA